MPRSRPLLVGLGLAAGVIVLDQLSKWAIMGVMRPPRVIEITSFFNLVVGWNSPLNAWVLVAVALVIVTVLMIWLSKTDRLRLGLALGLVIGGAIGNVIDRLRFGAVFDFLDFHAFGFHWPAFNVADSAITVGALVLVADSLFVHPEGRKVEDRERQGQGR